MQQRQVVAELQQDLIKRQSYLQYLMRYRQHLLSALENIDRFEDRLRNDRDMCNRHLIMVCVRMFLEKREAMIERFQEEFCALTVVDEKIDFIDEFMSKLMDELSRDGILYGMAGWQLQEARVCIERVLLQRLYRQVMFPNDDGDVSRDEYVQSRSVFIELTFFNIDGNPFQSSARTHQEIVAVDDAIASGIAYSTGVSH